MDTLAGGNTQTEAVVVSQQDLSGGGSGVGRVGSAVVVTGGGGGAGGGAGVEQGGCRGRGGRSRGSGGRGCCAREVQALVDTWGGGVDWVGIWRSKVLIRKNPIILKYISFSASSFQQ